MTKQPIFTADIAKMISDVTLGLWANPQNNSNLIGTYCKEATSHVAECLVLAAGEEFSSFTRVIFETIEQYDTSANYELMYGFLLEEIGHCVGAREFPEQYLKALQSKFNFETGGNYFGMLVEQIGDSHFTPYASLVIEMYNMLKAEGL